MEEKRTRRSPSEAVSSRSPEPMDVARPQAKLYARPKTRAKAMPPTRHFDFGSFVPLPPPSPPAWWKRGDPQRPLGDIPKPPEPPPARDNEWAKQWPPEPPPPASDNEWAKPWPAQWWHKWS